MDKLKKLTPKKILVWSLFILLFGLIVVLTIVPVIFDIANLNVEQWITNSLISLGIMICAIILGEVMGEDKQRDSAGGLYQKKLAEYNKILERLTDESQIIVYFGQFYVWFKARELKRKKESYLVDCGFEQLLAKRILQYIEKSDIELLKNGVVIKHDDKLNKDIKFKKISEEEAQIIEKIFSPTFTIEAPEYNYYLSAFGDSSSVSTLEQARKIEKKEHSNKTFNRTFKIVVSIFISFLWGTATVSDIVQGGNKTVAVNMVSRLIALFGGLLSGFLTSVVAVRLQAQKLENKTQVLTFMEIHYNKGEFVPKSYDELVEEELHNEYISLDK